jgi:SPP1 gp7 family putative phage head morphogenesis protein
MSHNSKAVRDGQKKLGASLATKLKAIGKEVAKKVSRVTKVEGDEEIDEALDGVDWAPIAGALQTQLVAVAGDGAKKTLLTLGVSDEGITDQTFDSAVEWAKARAAELVGKSWDEDGNLVDNPDADMAITDSMRDEIQDAVADAIENGTPAAKLADDIEELGSFSEDRAMMIARTEVIRANAQGQLSAFRGSGVVKLKAWSTSNEPEVCDDCQGNEDEGGIDLDDDFPSGDDAPPGHPNCLCVLVAVFEAKEDEEEDTDEESEDEAAE